MNFWKISEGGGGRVVSDPKNFVAIFFALETALLVMNFRKNFPVFPFIAVQSGFEYQHAKQKQKV